MLWYDVYAPKAEQNSTTHLNRTTRTIYPLSSMFKRQRRASSLEQMRLLSDLSYANTKQCCEIQCEVLEFSQEHK